MKAILVITLISLISAVNAQVNVQQVIIATNAEDALQSCQKKAAQSPRSLQAQMLKSCQCIVNQTDFKKAQQFHEAGQLDDLKALYRAAEKACPK